jgi:hypothetical protein
MGMSAVLPPLPLKFADIFSAVATIFSMVAHILAPIPAILAAVPAVFATIKFILPAVPVIFGAIKPSAYLPSFIAIQFTIVVAIKALKILLPECRFFIRIDGATAIGVDALPQRHTRS